MFRTLTCPSSGGQILLSQYLVSSLSVNGCTVCRMRADSAESEISLYYDARSKKHQTKYSCSVMENKSYYTKHLSFHHKG